jgi:predicted dienelactone hydrolase
MRRLLLATLVALAAATAPASADEPASAASAGDPAPAAPATKVGLAEFRFEDAASGRSLAGYAWYPTASEAPGEAIDANAVWTGFEAARDAAPADGRHPLVVLSHGWTGNRRNEAWLAVALAARGAIVAAPDHPGTTSLDHASAETPKLWERARDIGRVIDGITADPRFAGRIDPGRIAVAGHSMGGWTAMAVAGARIDMAQADRDCAAHPELATCKWLAEHADGAPAARPLYEQDLRDSRVKAVVPLDLGLTGGLSPASLAAIDVPVLVIAAGGRNPELPAALESRRLVARLPAARTIYLELPDAGHFSFLPVCKPGAYALLKTDEPGEEVVCLDAPREEGAPGRDRAALHAAVVKAVEDFLAGAGVLGEE